jgi:hypothetical protein
MEPTEEMRRRTRGEVEASNGRARGRRIKCWWRGHAIHPSRDGSRGRVTSILKALYDALDPKALFESPRANY